MPGPSGSRGRVLFHVHFVMSMAGGEDRQAAPSTVSPPQRPDREFGLHVYGLRVEFVEFAESSTGEPREGQPVLVGYKAGARRQADRWKGAVRRAAPPGGIVWAHDSDLVSALHEYFAELVDRRDLAAYPGMIGV